MSWLGRIKAALGLGTRTGTPPTIRSIPIHDEWRKRVHQPEPGPEPYPHDEPMITREDVSRHKSGRPKRGL